MRNVPVNVQIESMEEDGNSVDEMDNESAFRDVTVCNVESSLIQITVLPMVTCTVLGTGLINIIYFREHD